MKKIPEIRFPAFNGEWIEKRLGEIGKFYKGKNISKSDVFNNEELRMKNKEFYKCIHYGELFTKYNEVIKKIFLVTKIFNGFVGYRNDLLFPTSDVTPQGLAKCSSLQIDNVLLGGDIIALRPQKNVDSIFLSYQINSEHIKKKILILVTGTTIKHIYVKDLKSLKIHIPPTLDEQKKIADFLSSIDEKIEIISKKIEELKKYKKGMLQKLLNVKCNNGKCEPELRFKGFSGDWVEKRLGEVGKFFKGKGLSKSILTKNGKKCILYGELFTTYKEVITQIISKTNVKEGFLSKKGDILLPSSTTTKGIDLAKASAIFEDNVLLGGDIIIIRPNKNICSIFLSYILNHLKRKDIGKLATGMTIYHIYPKNLKKLKLHLPPTLAEQQKIASFLSSIDEKIELNENKLERLKAYKKGLLQKMFI